jgi:hypothetical protein
VDLTAEDFFEALCQDMIGRGTSSRELVALEFDPESGEISVIGRTAPLAAGYPALRTVLKYIGKVCVADGIGVHQLRRITFFEGEIVLEWVSRTGKWEDRTCSIAEVLQPPADPGPPVAS